MKRNYIFVFGSNEAGYHGAGAAAYARDNYGAIVGVGWGQQGDSFAIPTKDHNIETLPLDKIKSYVDQFVKIAKQHDDKCFYVTRIGCGLAGYDDEDIAPMFKGAPPNCILPVGWREINGEKP